jgi:hypothetical protein
MSTTIKGPQTGEVLDSSSLSFASQPLYPFLPIALSVV